MRRGGPPARLSAREAIRALPVRGRLTFQQGTGAPLSLLQALHDERERFEALDVYVGLVFADLDLLREPSENIHVTTWQVTGPTQKLVDSGAADFMPLRLSQVPELLTPGGMLPVDAALLQVSPPDERGYVSLGVSVCTMIDIARSAPLVIAEVNRQMPRTLGNSMVHLDEIDYLVDADYPVLQHRQSNIGDLERAIAEHVAELIPDGATIQMGIGAIPEALMFMLDDKKDLGVHSGMISDGFVPLIEKGVVNGRRKALSPGKVVCGEVMGGPDLYRFVHENETVHMDAVSYTHNPLVLAQLDNFISINSAVEIDLSGQINAETIGARQISGLGGQFDFIEGVLHSKGGVSIFAMPSTAGRGKISRITPRLAAGAAVSTPRYCADYVVTEFGAASLKGRTMRQRAEALIGVAHPDFRDGLANAMT